MTKDWCGAKYQLALENGHCVDMILGVHNPVNHKTAWHLRSHIVSDGIGAVTDLLRLNDVTITTQPHLKDPAKPHALKRFWLFLKHLRNVRPIDYAWEQFNPLARGPAKGMAFVMLSESATKALLQHCRAQSVTLSGWLLSALDKAAVKQMLRAPQERAWLVPMNMRGGTEVTNDAANYTSSLSLRLPAADEFPPQVIHQKIAAAFSQGLHWGAWIYSNFGKYVGLRGLRFIVRYMKPSHCWMGVFSNLGNWDFPTDGPVKDQWLVLSPPVSEYCPITTCCVSWHGRLTLNLQLHPQISHNLRDADRLLKAWCDLILGRSGIRVGDDDLRFGLVPWSEIASTAKTI